MRTCTFTPVDGRPQAVIADPLAMSQPPGTDLRPGVRGWRARGGPGTWLHPPGSCTLDKSPAGGSRHHLPEHLCPERLAVIFGLLREAHLLGVHHGGLDGGVVAGGEGVDSLAA